MNVCQKTRMIIVVLFFICISIYVNFNNCKASHTSIENNKNGIVEVQAGLENSAGKFYLVKSSSGFVVNNQGNGAYVITTNHTVNISEEEKKRFCKKNNISLDNVGLITKIRVVVDADVATNVEVKASSEKDDFCVLSAGDVLKRKSSLHIEDVCATSVGSGVYVLGYSEESLKNGKFDIENIEIHEGKIQDNSAVVDDGVYIQHSAVVLPEQSGGALINSEGYLIGMVNSVITNKKVDVYYALPIDRIRTILDNYGIIYTTREKDNELKKLQHWFDESKKRIASKEYKEEGIEVLVKEVTKTDEVFLQNEISMDEIKSCVKGLESANNGLVKKTSKTAIIKYIFLIVLFLAVLRMCIKIIMYKKIVVQIAFERNENDVAKDSGKLSINRTVKDVTGVSDNSSNEMLYEDDANKTILLRKNDKTQFSKQGLMQVDSDVFDPLRAIVIEQDNRVEVNVSKMEFTVGKNPENDYQIENDVISRKHALIFWQDKEYYIKDLGSANGTFLNGKEVKDEPEKLSTGDLIVIADVELIFVIR